MPHSTASSVVPIAKPPGAFRWAGHAARSLRRSALYLELGKARLSALVLLTTAVGFALGERGSVDWLRLAWTLVGTGLAALGANALNEWLEADRDAQMRRTRQRPLPARRIGRREALLFGIVSGAVGPALLLALVNVAAAALALAALLIYVLLYAPLKTRSVCNTLVGAVVGALPPLIGWVAATGGRTAPGAWILAGILFLWQTPHFLALAWLYRDDYARGGFRMLPMVDPRGHLTGCVVVMYTLVLLALTLLPVLVGMAGWWYAAGALLLGSALVILSAALERRRTDSAARRVFVASVVYLPLLLGLMVLDRQGQSPERERGEFAHATLSVAIPVAGASGSCTSALAVVEEGRPHHGAARESE